MKELSVFIDESGDFDLKSKHSPYYLFTLVFHDQERNIDKNLKALNEHIRESEGKDFPIHTAPLIRREYPYSNMEREDRKFLFDQLFYFARKCNIFYKTFNFVKKEYSDKFAILGAMSKKLSQYIRSDLAYFQSFDKVIVYYDNGQIEINQLLNSVLNIELNQVEFRKISPYKYRLSQVADLICTIELMALKKDRNELTQHEIKFFKNTRALKKTYIKGIREKNTNNK